MPLHKSVNPIRIGAPCAACGGPCEYMQHTYVEATMNGDGGMRSCKRMWKITAPLYYLGTKPFCSPQCALKGSNDAI